MEGNQAGRAEPIMVFHRCGHVQTYTVPGWLDTDARLRVASRLSRDWCSRCVDPRAWKSPRSLTKETPAA